MAKRSSDDVLDLLSSMNISLTSKKPVDKRRPLAEPKAAPFELMSQVRKIANLYHFSSIICIHQFLFLITENRMKEALQMTDQILELEPRNKTVLQYRTYLRQYIQQGSPCFRTIRCPKNNSIIIILLLQVWMWKMRRKKKKKKKMMRRRKATKKRMMATMKMQILTKTPMQKEAAVTMNQNPHVRKNKFISDRIGNGDVIFLYINATPINRYIRLQVVMYLSEIFFLFSHKIG